MITVRNVSVLGRYQNLWCAKSLIKRPPNHDLTIQTKLSYRRFKTRRQVKVDVEKSFEFPAITSVPKMRAIIRPALFTIAFSTASLSAAAIWQYESARSHTKSLFKSTTSWLEGYPKRAKWRQDLNKKWRSLRDGEKVFIPICLINVLVYLAWQVPNLKLTMVTYFSSNPSARIVCLPLILCTFSHYSFLHLLANMYVLHSFSESAVYALGKEQFVGMYLSAGCFSSLTSFIYKCAFGVPGLSVGASGAIMGVLGYVCTRYPETELSLLFLPMIHFKAEDAIKGLMLLDVAGCILKWKIFDHAAHLGGAVFGICWCYFGNQLIWQKRKYLTDKWHDLRMSLSK